MRGIPRDVSTIRDSVFYTLLVRVSPWVGLVVIFGILSSGNRYFPEGVEFSIWPTILYSVSRLSWNYSLCILPVALLVWVVVFVRLDRPTLAAGAPVLALTLVILTALSAFLRGYTVIDATSAFWQGRWYHLVVDVPMFQKGSRRSDLCALCDCDILGLKCKCHYFGIRHLPFRFALRLADQRLIVTAIDKNETVVYEPDGACYNLTNERWGTAFTCNP